MKVTWKIGRRSNHHVGYIGIGIRVAVVEPSILRDRLKSWHAMCYLPGGAIPNEFAYQGSVEDAKKVVELAVVKWFEAASAK